MSTIFRQKFKINGEVKCYFPKSEETRKINIRIANEKGYEVLENVKLYPVCSFLSNQHKLYNAVDRAWGNLYDAQRSGKDVEKAKKWLEKVERLQGVFDCSPQDNKGIVYVVYEDYKAIKDIIGAYNLRH